MKRSVEILVVLALMVSIAWADSSISQANDISASLGLKSLHYPGEKIQSQNTITVSGDFDATLASGADYLKHMQADITDDNAGNGTDGIDESPDDPDDGGWDWRVTSPPAPFFHTTATSPTNIYGATGLGLYYAYLETNDPSYFIALTDAANIMKDNPNIRSASDYIFLMNYNDLPGVAGTAYADSAKAKFDGRVANYGSATALAQYIRDVRNGQGYGNGIIAWDIGLFAVAADMLYSRYPADPNNYDTAADDIAEVLWQDSFNGNPGYFDIIADAGWDSTWANTNYWWYTLGLTGLIDAFSTSNTHVSEIPGLVTRLLDSQFSSGAVSGSYGANSNDEDWQSTAYSMLSLAGLDQTTYQPEINRMAYWLSTTQDVSGSWKYSSGNHYPEVVGECVAGMYFSTNDISNVLVDDDFTNQADVDVYNTANNTNYVWGYDAFATIQEGINSVTASTVNIVNGTYVETLDINKNLTLIGESEAGVIIDASSFNDYGIYASGDYNVTLQNFTVIGPTPYTYGYGLKVAGDNANITISDVTVQNSGRSGFDLNGVIFGSLQNITSINNGGVGLGLTDCDNVTVSGITTTGNGWGGIGIYTLGTYYTGGSDNVTISGINSFGEIPAIYTETGGGFPITNLNISTIDFPYTVGNNLTPEFTVYFADLLSATGAAIAGDPVNSFINDRSDGSFVVPAGLTIQAAITAAIAGDVINVLAGTFREQLYIDKGIDLIGVDSATCTVESPDVVNRTTYSITQWSGPARTIDAIIGVNGAGIVNISGFTIDGRDLGPDNYYGIHYFNTNGSVTQCVIDNITYPASPGAQRVASLVATHGVGETFTIDFSNNNIPIIQKGGILIMGPGATFTVNNNMVYGVASSSIAGNCIQLSYGATGSTLNNYVEGTAYTGEDWASTGILLFESGDVSMVGDEVYNCQSGVNFSDWGWVYSHPSPVNLSFTNLNLHENEWTLGAQLSRDNSDPTITITGCDILNSTGDGIDIWGTGPDPWGGSYYTGWNNGDLNVTITDCNIRNSSLDGIWTGDLSGNANNVSFTAFNCDFTGNVGSAINNTFSQTIDATECYWNSVNGPIQGTLSNTMRTVAAMPRPFGVELPETYDPIKTKSTVGGSISSIGETIYGPIDYDPWCSDETHTYCTLTSPVTEVWVDDDWVGSLEGDFVGGHIFGYDAFATIQDGIDGVTGSTVNVFDGSYGADAGTGICAYIAKDSLNLIGQSETGTIIDGSIGGVGSSGLYWPKGIHIQANNVTIENFTVTGFTGDMISTGGYGVLYRDYAHDMPGEGYIFYNECSVSNVTVQNCYSAVYALCFTNLTISNCDVLNNFSDGMFIARGSDNAIIHDNNVTNSGDHGIWVGYSWLALLASNNAAIFNNDVDGAREGGISFVASDSAEIYNNSITNVSSEGWSVGALSLKDGPTNVNVHDNFIFGNSGAWNGNNGLGHGVGIDANASGITLYHNKIYNNDGMGVYNGSTLLVGNGVWQGRLSEDKIPANSDHMASSPGLITDLVLIDAESNWWGSYCGPYHPTLNPGGAGNSVSDSVDFEPWCNEDFTICTFDANPPSVVWVDDDYAESLTNDGHYWCLDAFDNIQDGVEAVASGGTVIVAAGSYEEQVAISKELRITGAGKDITIIQSPAILTEYFTTSGDNYPIVYIHDITGVVIEGLTIDGLGRGNSNYRFVGVGYWNSGGDLIDIRFTGVRDTPFSGAQHGVSVYAYNNTGGPYAINLTNVDVDDMQKTAFALSGGGLTANVINCTVVGAGPTTTTAQNGIQIGFGATGSITGCEVSGMDYTGPSWAASGILLYYPGPGMIMSGNNVHNCQGALNAYFADSLSIDSCIFNQNSFEYIWGGDGIVVTNNSFTNSFYEALYIADATNLSATGNLFDSNATSIVIDGLVNGVIFNSNDLINSTAAGVVVQPYLTDEPTNVVFNSNNISGNAFGISNATSNIVNAVSNWWGDATGPDTGTVVLLSALPERPVTASLLLDGQQDRITAAANRNGTVSLKTSIKNKAKGDELITSVGSGDKVSTLVDYSPWWGADYVGDSHTSAWQWYVDNSNNSTIQEGIDIALSGDIVNVTLGSYNENVTLNKSLSLLGTSGAVLDGTSLSGAGINIELGNVIVDSLEIQNYPDGILAYAGSNYYADWTNIQISNNVIHDITGTGGAHGFGIYVGTESERYNPADPLGIYDPALTDLLDFSGLNISGNTIHNTAQAGTVLQSLKTVSDTVTVVDNEIYNTPYSAIWLDAVHEINILGNNLHDCGTGVFFSSYADGYYEQSPDDTFDPKNIRVDGNDLLNNTKGFAVYDCWPDSLIFFHNRMIGHSNLAFYNYIPFDIDATHNYWGSDRGPTHITNLYGDGDTVGNYISFDPWCNYDFTICDYQAGACDYVIGDVNGSGGYNGLDVTYGVAYLKGGPAPVFECECTPDNYWYVSGDVNASCSYNGLDITYGVAFFKGGDTPQPCPDCEPISLIAGGLENSEVDIDIKIRRKKDSKID